MLFATAALVGPNSEIALAAIFSCARRERSSGRPSTVCLPELLPQERLSWANGVLELGTFLAIIVGSVSGSFLAEAFDGREVYFSGGCCSVFRFSGLAGAFGISRVPPRTPQRDSISPR